MKDLYKAISPEIETFDSEEKKMALQEAIKCLPEDLQNILELRFTLHLPMKVIAGELGYSAGTISLKLHRALTRLKKQFYPQEFAEIYQVLYGNPHGPNKALN